MVAIVNLVGRKFGRLTVTALSHRSPDRTWHWRCECECGELTVSAGRNLKAGKSKSCDCVHGVPISDPIEHWQLCLLLTYDPLAGTMTWLRDGRRFKAGTAAGYTCETNPYIRIGLGERSYLAHILAWFYVTGAWPEKDIDHKDRDPSNNCWANLRLATGSENCANSGLHSDNTTGYRGVSKRPNGIYRVTLAGKDIGTFSTAEAAARAYDSAAVKLFGEFAFTNFEAVE